MTLEVVSFIIGGLLIATAVVGGGFEIKEIRMPRVGAGARTGALVVGLLFILMGLGIWETNNQQHLLSGNAGKTALQPERAAEQSAPDRSVPATQPPAVKTVDQAAPAQEPPAVAPPQPAGITGRAHLSWNLGGDPYEATIETYGQTGVVRVAFIGQSGYEEQVDQDLVLQQGDGFLFYRGMNPRYAGTDTPHPSYSPDGFRLVELRTGVWSITEMCDEQGACAPVETEALP
ncbi:MAG TPA: hypothetical protein VFR37_02490 [Longimicrobium sp.]|nr:hypothetical protein [Longimicrobium sp.]